jgi:hypothetical protein
VDAGCRWAAEEVSLFVWFGSRAGSGGLGPPWLFGTGHPWVGEYAPAGHDHTQWHHYAMAWDVASMRLTAYMDGVKVYDTTVTYAGASSWTTKEPFILVGANCYNQDLRAGVSSTSACAASTSTASPPATCHFGSSPDILIDDLAFFRGALSEADMAARWDQSLTARLAAGLEPQLVLFYNFNDPQIQGGIEVNRGSAGSIGDLVTGRLKPNGVSGGDAIHNIGGGLVGAVTLPTAAPNYVPCDIPTRASDPSSVPLVVGAVPGATTTVSYAGSIAGLTAGNLPTCTSLHTRPEISGSSLALQIPGTRTHLAAMGVSCTFQAPSPFTATYMTTCGGASMAVVPLDAPTLPDTVLRSTSTLEDNPLVLKLFGSTTSAEGFSPVIRRIGLSHSAPLYGGHLHTLNSWESTPQSR